MIPKKESAVHLGAKRFFLTASFILSLTLPFSGAFAHRVTIFAWVEGGMVHTESKFSGGKPVKGGNILVYDAQSGDKLLEGATDDKGEFSFKAPRKASLRIELIAGMGHKGEWLVSEDEFDAKEGPGTSPDDSGTAVASRSPEADQPAQRSPLNMRELEDAVERALDRKIAPMMKLLAQSRQQQGPNVRDVVGGIGYIFGLVGLGAYLHFRRKARQVSRP
jgi:nickel transport protein